jgi:hypothetical protein
MDDLTNSDTRTQIHNNLAYVISSDGGDTWTLPVNVTQFQPHDADCNGCTTPEDSLIANRDTLNLYTDCAVMITPDDYIHIGFTVQSTYRYMDGDVGNYWYPYRSIIYHWTNEFHGLNGAEGEVTPVAVFFEAIVNADTSALIDPGAWQLYCQRPNFAYDATTGDLFCVYQQYMPGQYSNLSFGQGDIFVSRSCNRGRTWSQGVNITRTDGGQNTSPPGSRDEREPTVAARVTHEGVNAYLHIQYVLDHDAGSCVQDGEGTVTLNEVYYQKVLVDSIPSRPLTDPFWPTVNIDSLGYPSFSPNDTIGDANCGLGEVGVTDRGGQVPSTFRLYQNYPNPFNPSTEIQFDLPRSSRVTLKVYNVLGQNVATLFDKQMLSAGAKIVSFDGSRLASGVYMYQIDVDGRMQTMKMILMK